MVQLMPEAMDLFAAGIEDGAGVVCQSTASMAPPPAAGMFLHALVHPLKLLSGAIFTTLYNIASRYDPRYPCAAPLANEEDERRLVDALGRKPGVRENDGVVPIRSQLWGKLVWVGYGDHLDVLGHFDDRRRAHVADLRASGLPGGGEAAHVDWLYSGSAFDRARFESLVDAIAGGLLRGAGTLTRAA
jgi:hypothetical protein